MEIRSIDLVDFKLTISKWIDNQPLPTELKRILVQEVLNELNVKAREEVYAQVRERDEQDVERVEYVPCDPTEKED